MEMPHYSVCANIWYSVRFSVSITLSNVLSLNISQITSLNLTKISSSGQTGKICLKKILVYDWHRKLVEGWAKFENTPRACRPRTNLTGENIDVVRDIHECTSSFNCQLLDSQKDAYWRKRREFPIQDTIRPRMVNLTCEKLEELKHHWIKEHQKQHWNTFPIILTYLCDYQMFGFLRKH